MIHVVRFAVLLHVVIFVAAPAWGDEQILLCDRNIYDESHPFFWNNLKEIVPENLGPGEAHLVYSELLRRYTLSVTEQDKALPFVQSFIALQRDIVDGLKSANLVIKPGLAGEELSAGATPIAKVSCAAAEMDVLVTAKYLTIAYKKVHDQSWEALRAAAGARIGALDRQYSDWFNNGLPMWPLETWANGLLLDEADAKAPKRWQLVVLRPTVGLAVNSDDNWDEVKPEATLGLEPLGFVKYRAKDYSSYWGASVLLTAGDDAGIGYGLLGRYNNYVLGLSRRDDNTATGVSNDDTYVFIGFDLYDAVHAQQERFRDFKGKVRANLEKYRP